MTDEKKAKIETLAVIAAKAKEKYDYLGLLNTSGRTQSERDEMAKDYAVAEAEFLETRSSLKAAQQPDAADSLSTKEK